MRKFERFVIYDEEMGVFLGHCIGMGFWSRLDPVGQDSAVTFVSEEQAHELMVMMGKQDCRVVEVRTEDERYASIAECVEAGIPAWSPWDGGKGGVH